jgi:hypothetical protein
MILMNATSTQTRNKPGTRKHLGKINLSATAKGPTGQAALRWIAMMSGSPALGQWEPETVRTYLVRVADKLLAGNRQLTAKTPNNPPYPQAWDDWVAVDLGA